MADPVSLILGGAGLGALGSISSGQTQAANYQAQVNAQNYNSQVQQQQADQAMANAVAQSNAQQQNAKQQLGLQRAATAQSGIGFSGTGGDLIDQSAANAELDRQNILYSGMLTAQGLDAQAEQSTYAAQVAQSQINPSLAGGYIGAGANALSGVGNYMSYNRKATNAAKGYMPGGSF